MGLKNCSTCNKEMAISAKGCPHCGAPNVLIEQRSKKKIRNVVIAALALAIIFILFLAISTKRPNMNKDVYELGIKAIEHADDYLDGKLSSGDAALKLERIHDQLGEIEGHDSLIISTDVLVLKLKISSFDRTFSDTTNSDVVAKRNDLANHLNVKRR